MAQVFNLGKKRQADPSGFEASLVYLADSGSKILNCIVRPHVKKKKVGFMELVL